MFSIPAHVDLAPNPIGSLVDTLLMRAYTVATKTTCLERFHGI